MKLAKFITILVVLLMGITPAIPQLSATKFNNVNNQSATPETHIIENVSYVSQGNSLYCAYATVTMIFQHYGINTSLFEVLFNSGVGYSIGYKITYPCFWFFRIYNVSGHGRSPVACRDLWLTL